MIKKENLYFNFFFVISLVYIIFTNNFFNFEQSIIYGAADGETYMQIAKAAPNISSEELVYHKAERFIIPYIIGSIAYIANVDIFTMFRVFSFISIVLILFIFLSILNELKVEIFQKYYLFSLLVFNPYIIRYYLSLPTLINDVIFIFSGALFIFSILKNKKKYIYLAIIIGAACRINTIFFLLAIIATKFFYKKKFIFSTYDIIISLIIFYIISLINSHHANLVGGYNYAYDLKIRFGLFFSSFSSKELLIFILFPLINFLPLIFIPFFFNFRFNYIELMNDKLLFISLIVFLMISFTAFVAGPIITGKNLIRLINLSYPFIIYMIYKLINNSDVSKKNIQKFIFLSFMILWSLHPTYSNIKLLNPVLNIFKH